MNRNDAALDARLRSLLGTLDARPGFEARVAARVEARAAARVAAREAWSNGLTIASLGMAASALVWRYAADISQWMQSGAVSAALESRQFSTLSSAVLLLALWPWVGALLTRRLP